jgi:serine/threonine protein kinase
MAPEVALKRSYTELVDVYSFGILIWQMAKDKLPFKGFNKEEFIRNVVVGRQRPKIGQSWPTAFSSLLQRCWETSPFDRPNFAQIVAELNQLIGSGTPTGVRASAFKAPPVASRGKGADSTWF